MNTITIELSAEDRARLDAILEALKNITSPAKEALTAARATKTQEPVKVSTESEKTAEKATEDAKDAKEPKPAPAPDRRTVKSLAVKKIQAGHRDEVKALIQAYGAEKIDLVPEDRLAAFLADLEAI